MFTGNQGFLEDSVPLNIQLFDGKDAVACSGHFRKEPCQTFYQGGGRPSRCKSLTASIGFLPLTFATAPDQAALAAEENPKNERRV